MSTFQSLILLLLSLSWTYGATIRDSVGEALSLELLRHLNLIPALFKNERETNELVLQLASSLENIKYNMPTKSNYQNKFDFPTNNNENVSTQVNILNIGGGIRIHIATVKNVDWFHAMQFCKSLGMRLLSLETRDKSLRVQAYLAANGYNDYMWTSGIRLDNTWIWSAKDEIFTYTGWHASQPNNGDERCVIVQPGYWADAPCSATIHEGYICESEARI